MIFLLLPQIDFQRFLVIHLVRVFGHLSSSCEGEETGGLKFRIFTIPSTIFFQHLLHYSS
jgi:hypothetical protein